MITRESVIINTTGWTKVQDQAGYCQLSKGRIYFAFTEQDQEPDNNVTGNYATGNSSFARIEVPNNQYLWARIPAPGYYAELIPNY